MKKPIDDMEAARFGQGKTDLREVVEAFKRKGGSYDEARSLRKLLEEVIDQVYDFGQD